jgi:hypothetical protein
VTEGNQITWRQEKQCTYNVILRRVYETIVAMEKLCVLLTSLCVCMCAQARASKCSCVRARVALHSQHAKRMRRIRLSSVVSAFTTFFDIIS